VNHRPPAALTASLLVRKGAAKPMGSMAEPDVVANEALARRHKRSLPLLEIAERARVEADTSTSGLDPEYSGEHVQTAMDLSALWDSTAPLANSNGAQPKDDVEGNNPNVADADSGELEAAAELVSRVPPVVLVDTPDEPQHPLPVVFQPLPLPVTYSDVDDFAADSELADADLTARPEPSKRLWFRSMAAALLLLTAGGLAGFLMVRMVADSRGIQVSAEMPAYQPTAGATPHQAAMPQSSPAVVEQGQTGSTQLTAIIQAAADKVASADEAAAPTPLFPTPARALASDSGPIAGNDTIASSNRTNGVPAPRRRRGVNDDAAAQPPVPLRRPDAAPAQAIRPGNGDGAYRVQIGTVYSAADLEQEMVRLRNHFPDLLGDAEIFVETRAGRYRLMTGRFADAGSAEATCDLLKANRQNCLVVRR